MERASDGNALFRFALRPVCAVPPFCFRSLIAPHKHLHLRRLWVLPTVHHLLLLQKSLDSYGLQFSTSEDRGTSWHNGFPRMTRRLVLKTQNAAHRGKMTDLYAARHGPFASFLRQRRAKFLLTRSFATDACYRRVRLPFTKSWTSSLEEAGMSLRPESRL